VILEEGQATRKWARGDQTRKRPRGASTAAAAEGELKTAALARAKLEEELAALRGRLEFRIGRFVRRLPLGRQRA
jgi:hypothetical protein